MSIKKMGQDVPTHTHSWGMDPKNISQERCHGCSGLRISQEEYDRRIEEWNNYFQMVANTESYDDYRKANQILGQSQGLTQLTDHEKSQLKEIADRATKRMESTEYMDKPAYPDPSTWNKYEIT